MSWTQERWVVFDTETTGTDVEEDRIVTSALVFVGGGQPAERPDGAPILIDPGIPIPEGATAVHGITTAEAQAQGWDAAQGVAWIAAELANATATGMPVVGMNLRYDLTLLDRECARHNVVPPWERGHPFYAIDALVLDKYVDTYRRGSRKLVDLCALYQVGHDGAHEADADAIAAGRVAWRIGTLHEELAAMELAELHNAQIGWAAEQAQSLASYFDRIGKEHDVRPEWPIVPRPLHP